MNDDHISSILGLRPLEEAKKDLTLQTDEKEEILPIQFENPSDDETIQDIEFARENVKDIINQGDEALKKLITLASDSESPRAFEVVSTIMKTLLEANKDFVDISHKRKYAKEEVMRPQKESQTNITNNNLILSTADLLNMIKGNSLDK